MNQTNEIQPEDVIQPSYKKEDENFVNKVKESPNNVQEIEIDSD